MATSKNHTGIFKKILVDFIGQEDPILAMLEWTLNASLTSFCMSQTSFL